LHISNPDLAERLINNLELNTELNMKGLYNGVEEGYTDYPTYEQQQKLK
jgi:N-ethylmaleimide reductase